MSGKVPGRVIYIGSIPYDQTEEQVLDIAKSIGPVVSLRMMFDKDTGRSKGFAFVEYNDMETAASAVRNLNNYAIGNRTLRCDFSSEQSLSGGAGGNNNNNNNNTTNNSNGNNTKFSRRDELPPFPPGVTLQNGQSYAEVISSTLNGVEPSRLQKLIGDAVAMSKKNPVLMEQLLSHCPQLSYALVEALLKTSSASPDQITGLLLNNPAVVKQEGAAAGAGASSEVAQEEQLDEEKIALIKQVLAIPDEDLIGLPDEQKIPILEIKENFKNGVYGNIML